MSNNLGVEMQSRYDRIWALTDLDAAIGAYHNAVDASPAESPARPGFLSNLGICLRKRYRRTGALTT